MNLCLPERGPAPKTRLPASLRSRPSSRAGAKHRCCPRPLPAESALQKALLSNFISPFCNSSLDKSQSKLTNRRFRACPHKQLWEKVPGQPYIVRTSPKGAATEAVRGSLFARPPSLPDPFSLSTLFPGSCLARIASLGTGSSGPPRKGRRGYESAPSAGGSCCQAVEGGEEVSW